MRRRPLTGSRGSMGRGHVTRQRDTTTRRGRRWCASRAEKAAGPCRVSRALRWQKREQNRSVRNNIFFYLRRRRQKQQKQQQRTSRSGIALACGVCARARKSTAK